MPDHSLQSACLAEFAAAGVWACIRQAYSEAHRAYHTLAHLEAMFGDLAERGTCLHHPRAVRWAIWFHDYVYRTEPDRYPLNETLSASAMEDVLQKNCPDFALLKDADLPCLELAQAMIVATKHHRPHLEGFNDQPQALADCRVLLDLDLSILAQPEAQVRAFDERVRREFSQYGERDFAAGRIQALQGFLQRERIYLSPSFMPHEAMARANLGMLIAHWRHILDAGPAN